MIKIAIRIDDITADMDWDRFNRFADILDKYSVCPLIGVIPDNKDDTLAGTCREDYAAWLKERVRKGWVIAMHGYNHKYVTKKGGLFPLNLFSEYAGRSLEEQNEMIRDGKCRLSEQGIATNIFMAPAHSFDSNTVRALKMNGFEYITDGFGYKPFIRKDITWLPISFRRSSDIDRKDGYTTLVYHVWNMDDKDFVNFEKLLATRRDQIINYSELLDADTVRANVFSVCGQYIKATVKRILVKIKG